MKNHKILLYIAFYIICCGCERFLEEKPDKSLAVPSTLRDLQSLMDNYSNVNGNTPGIGELSADDYYLLDDIWANRSDENRRCYIWAPDYCTSHLDWFPTYRVVYYANNVLDVVGSIERTEFNWQEWDNVKGQAYFLRASSFLHLTNIWTIGYNDETARIDLGIPLRLSPDFNEASDRSSISDTYKQIISDLTHAIELLPDVPEHVIRPSKPAAMALLARTYLFMRDYEKCLHYASASLEIKNELMDYNQLNAAGTYVIPEFNKEIIYHSTIQNAGNPMISVSNALVDTVLFKSYSEYDLRRLYFFRDNQNGTHTFTGNYSGTSSRFSGIAVDEVLLMRIECLARVGNVIEAMTELNNFLACRYKSDFAPPIVVNTKDEALRLILEERRKQLLMRGLRFPDVKRLNMEGANIYFRRIVNDTEYSLPPNDPRFAVSIPERVIELGPLIQQNYR